MKIRISRAAKTRPWSVVLAGGRVAADGREIGKLKSGGKVVTVITSASTAAAMDEAVAAHEATLIWLADR
ncbi:MAG: hypothetical protein EXQ89_05130 [Rhodospirillaceae bacterium]|nr:hypothetical protein [Rhodospirillaceae bacterium]